MKKEYHPEDYWSEVGQRIESREKGKNVIAGDDEPYYRYKRVRFLEMLHSIGFEGKSVFEIGNGPGGNLLEVVKRKPSRLVGVDISSQMVRLAKSKVPKEVEVIKINGTELPFEDKTFDIVFTATVLQHNTDEAMLVKIMQELSRVSKEKVCLFEQIDHKMSGDELCYWRPVSYYEKIMNKNGFMITGTEYINIRTSYYVSGAIRKGLNSRSRKEGEPLNGLSIALQNATLPITKQMDKIFTSKIGLAKLIFERM